jgi:hypothetical protein
LQSLKFCLKNKHTYADTTSVSMPQLSWKSRPRRAAEL